MREILFRCSSIGKLMTAPVSIDPALITPEVEAIQAKKKRTDEEKAVLERLKLGTLSETAKTYIRELVRQELWGVDFEVSSKYTDKGLAVEAEGLALLNRVRGLTLAKNTERRSDGQITGEADTVDLGPRRCGHDLKCSWSLQTFPAFVRDCQDSLYEWQMRGYMRLWDVDRWEVNYAMVNTPEELLGQYEPQQLHLVEHIPEHMRLTTWAIERDRALEAQMDVKLELARTYYAQCIAEFAATHPEPAPAASDEAPPQPELIGFDLATQPDLHVEVEMAPIPALQPAALDQLQLQELVASGQTLKLGQINARLGIFEISATTANAVGVQTVKDRGAVHMPATSFAAFCDGLIAHIADVRDSFKPSHEPSQRFPWPRGHEPAGRQHWLCRCIPPGCRNCGMTRTFNPWPYQKKGPTYRNPTGEKTMSEYKTLLQQKAELDARIAEVMKTEKAGAAAEARALIQQYQLTEQDVFPASGSKAKGSVGTPKFRDPETGATWTGRGKPPNWIVGKDRQAFLIS